MSETVRQPAHYRADTGIEAIDVIRAWSVSFSVGSAIKYLARCGHKPGTDAREDLQKALWYIAEEIGGKALANDVAALVALYRGDLDKETTFKLVTGVMARIHVQHMPAEPKHSTSAAATNPTPEIVNSPVDLEPAQEGTPDVTLPAAGEPIPPPNAEFLYPMVSSARCDTTMAYVGPPRLEEQEPVPAPSRAPLRYYDDEDAPKLVKIVKSVGKQTDKPAVTPAVTPAKPARRTPPPPRPDGTITTPEAAKLLGRPLENAPSMLRSARVQERHQPHAKTLLWDRADVERLAARRKPGRDTLSTTEAAALLGHPAPNLSRRLLAAGLTPHDSRTGAPSRWLRADIERLAAQKTTPPPTKPARVAAVIADGIARVPDIAPAAPTPQPKAVAAEQPSESDFASPAFDPFRMTEYAAVIAQGIAANPDAGEFWVVDLAKSLHTPGATGVYSALLLTRPGSTALKCVALHLRRRGNDWIYRHPETGEKVRAGRRQPVGDIIGIPSTAGLRASDTPGRRASEAR